jgi:hypothetical protein
VSKILITGMSGTGKSTAPQVLDSRRHRTVDTDTDRWSHWVTQTDGSPDWVWREQAMTDLLVGHSDGSLIVAGCKTNQGRSIPFDHIVLLSAPADVLLACRCGPNNPYGKQPVADFLKCLVRAGTVLLGPRRQIEEGCPCPPQGSGAGCQ